MYEIQCASCSVKYIGQTSSVSAQWSTTKHMSLTVQWSGLERQVDKLYQAYLPYLAGRLMWNATTGPIAVRSHSWFFTKRSTKYRTTTITNNYCRPSHTCTHAHEVRLATNRESFLPRKFPSVRNLTQESSTNQAKYILIHACIHTTHFSSVHWIQSRVCIPILRVNVYELKQAALIWWILSPLKSKNMFSSLLPFWVCS